MGYILASPLRRLYQNPETIVFPYCKPGMRVLEIGPGMGFFSLPMAEKIGSSGKIYCVDVQENVLQRKLDHRVELRRCSEASLEVHDLNGTIDFALAFAVVHEVPDPDFLLDEIAVSLRPGGILLIAEPRGHVDETGFAELIRRAETHGFRNTASPDIRGSHAALLKH
jgi:ubiquinone/menaquinone biosynthesis C-methylase UbiE